MFIQLVLLLSTMYIFLQIALHTFYWKKKYETLFKISLINCYKCNNFQQKIRKCEKSIVFRIAKEPATLYAQSLLEINCFSRDDVTQRVTAFASRVGRYSLPGSPFSKRPAAFYVNRCDFGL